MGYLLQLNKICKLISSKISYVHTWNKIPRSYIWNILERPLWTNCRYYLVYFMSTIMEKLKKYIFQPFLQIVPFLLNRLYPRILRISRSNSPSRACNKLQGNCCCRRCVIAHVFLFLPGWLRCYSLEHVNRRAKWFNKKSNNRVTE